MKVDFATSKLEKACADDKSRRRAFGPQRANLMRKRLTALVGASNLEELRHAPGRLHELTGDRAWQLSLDLDGPYRLIFEPVLTKDAHEDHASGLLWPKITHVRILGIEDTHA